METEPRPSIALPEEERGYDLADLKHYQPKPGVVDGPEDQLEKLGYYQPEHIMENSIPVATKPVVEEEHTELTPEQVIEKLEQQLLERFEQANILITAERWRLLLPEISYLNDTEFKQQPAVVEATKKNDGKLPERINALVSRDGTVVVNEHFLKLNEIQQQHVLAHEASHRLSWFLEHSGSVLYQEVAKSIDSLHSSEVSLYVAYIENSYLERKKAGKQTMSETELAAKLHEEKSAEILAQYLTAQGKFGRMMRGKFLKFSNDGSSLAAWLEQPGAEDLLKELDQFDSDPPLSKDEQEAFFAKCPELRAHYRLYSQLGQLFNSHSDLDRAFEQVDQYDLMDDDFLEYDELAQPYLIQSDEINSSLRPETTRTAPGPNFLNFIFYRAVN